MFTPFVFGRDDLFRLGAAVGPLADNKPDDVAKIETALDGLGFFNVNPRQGPSGEFHAELDQGLRKFQRARGLKEVGVVNPGGPTLRKMAQEMAEAPGPDVIDDSAPIGRPSGIKTVKPDPGFVQDSLDLWREYIQSLHERFKKPRGPGGIGGGFGRPSGRPGHFNRKTGRFDDIDF